MGFFDSLFGGGSDGFFDALRKRNWIPAIGLAEKVSLEAVDQDGSSVLVAAVRTDQEKLVKCLLKRGCSVNGRDANGTFALFAAVMADAAVSVRCLLEAGADTQCRDKDGNNPLMVALKRGNRKIAIQIMARSTWGTNHTEETPLHLAAVLGDLEIMGILIGDGAAIDSTDRNRLTPLGIVVQKHGPAVARQVRKMFVASIVEHSPSQATRAFFGQDLELIAEFLDVRPDLLRKTDPKTGENWFFQIKDPDVLKLLAQRGLDTNQEDRFGHTPLEASLDKGSPEKIRALLQAGADPNRRNRHGETPYMRAKVGKRHLALLEEFGGREIRSTSLHSIHAGSQTEEVVALLDQGEDVNAKDSLGRTPLHFAARHGLTEIVSLLISCGAELFHPQMAEPGKHGSDCNGAAPLHLAVMNGHGGVVAKLIEAGADPHAQGPHGDSPLFVAVRHDRPDMLRLLLSLGVDINHQVFYQTALAQAVKCDRLECAKLLVEAGIDILGGMESEKVFNLSMSSVMRQFLLPLKPASFKTLEEQSFNAVCELCGKGFCQGLDDIRPDQLVNFDPFCLLCRKKVCPDCGLTYVLGENDQSVRICHPCASVFGYSFEGCFTRGAVRFARTLKGRSPEESISCPVCGKEGSIRDAVESGIVCDSCHLPACPGCVIRGQVDTAECHACEKKRKEEFEAIVAGQEQSGDTCQRCGTRVKGVYVTGKLFVKGTVPCMNCGKAVCQACRKLNIRRGNADIFCLECFERAVANQGGNSENTCRLSGFPPPKR